MAYYEQDVENLYTANVEKRLAGGLIVQSVEKFSTFIVENQVVNSGMWRIWKTYAPGLWKTGRSALTCGECGKLIHFWHGYLIKPRDLSR